MIDLSKYYGLDWLAMALSIWAVYLLGNKNKWGFISFISANALWVYVGIFLMSSYGIAVGNFVFLILNTRGYLKWNQNEKLASQS
jgi:hypothetical protein